MCLILRMSARRSRLPAWQTFSKVSALVSDFGLFRLQALVLKVSAPGTRITIQSHQRADFENFSKKKIHCWWVYSAKSLSPYV